ncbi:MAG: hypothetical protein RBU27_05475 [Bacteroidota bacterium]|jgi:hypothetical protein|nr:hypothetical protein [Bacteroidota bacterium]
MAINPQTSQMLQQLFSQLAAGVPGAMGAAGPASIAQALIPILAPGGGKQPAAGPAAQTPQAQAPQVSAAVSAMPPRQAMPSQAVPSQAMPPAVEYPPSPVVAESAAARPQFPAYGVGKSASMADLLNIGLQAAQGGGGDQKGKKKGGPVNIPFGMTPNEYIGTARNLGIAIPGVRPWEGFRASDNPDLAGPPLVSAHFDPIPERVTNFENPNFRLNNKVDPDVVGTVINTLYQDGKGTMRSDLKKMFAQVQTGNLGTASKQAAYMQEAGMMAPGRYGRTSGSYADLMVNRYGKPNAQRLVDMLRNLYRENAGGAMAEMDIASPISIQGSLHSDNGVLGWVDPLNPDVANLPFNRIMHSKEGSPGTKTEETAKLRRALPEEMGHVLGLRALANPENPTTRFQRRGAGTGAFLPILNRDSESEILRSDRPVTFIWPDGIMEDKLGQPDLYNANLEEMRAKWVDQAQVYGVHPLLHPKGVEAGIDAMIQRMGSDKKLAPDMENYMRLYDAASPEKRKSLKSILKVIFTNWAEAKPQPDMFGISLPNDAGGTA